MALHDDEEAEESSLLLPSSRRGELSYHLPERLEMDKTTHNDPLAKRESKNTLFGSTRILQNIVIAHAEVEITASLRGLTGTENPKPMKTSSSFARVYQKSTVLFLEKVKSTFFEDARSLAEGTIPQSVVVAFVIGTVCGVACWLYYRILFFFLGFIWETIPERFVVGHWEVHNYWLYIPLTVTIFVTFVGLTVVLLGEPGDLPYTISRVHHYSYIPVDHVLPMAFASLFSILAGGSLGPEAPLVAICGAFGGFISRHIFRQTNVHVVRKHTLMGMSGALSAFFGVPLGGSLFALEVCSRFGVEYFEHLIESVFCGELCLVVFRSLSGLAITPIWDMTQENGRIFEIEPVLVLVGGVLGLVGAFMAYIFASFHAVNMSIFANLGLLDNSRAVYRAWLGGFFIILMGILAPQVSDTWRFMRPSYISDAVRTHPSFAQHQTMFWGEEEIQVVANWSPAAELPNVWPTTGYTGLEMKTAWNSLLVGIAKLIAISFTVAGGLRGGYIFPLMMAGACFGRTVHCFLPSCIPLQICVLCTAAGINVAITRTALASTLILAFLPGEPCAIPAILMASLCSLFATAYLPFIKSQITRSDIDHSLYHHEGFVGKLDEQLNEGEMHMDDGEVKFDDDRN
jgi:H+/Cl- antiporter ClcA